jgi:periplasmic protein CpxP/Spy
MRSSSTTLSIGVALVALALAYPAAVRAQTTTGTASQTVAPAAGAPAPQAAPSRQDMVEQRIADIHATLHVTPAQEAKFERFAQVMRDNAQAMDANVGRRASKAATETAVENLQNYAQFAEEHAQDVRKLSAAFKTFYAGLAPAQKMAADEMFRARAAEKAAQSTKPAG